MRILTDALNDRSKGQATPLGGDYRWTALDALGIVARKNPIAIPAIAAALGDINFRLSRLAADILLTLRRLRPEARQLVEDQLANGPQEARIILAISSLDHGNAGHSILSIIASTIYTNESTAKSAALFALAVHGVPDEEAFAAVKEAARGDDVSLRPMALRALAKVGSEKPETMPLLIEALSSPIEDVRVAALVAVASLGRKANDARPIVGRLLNDSNPAVRGLALKALVEFDPSSNDLPDAIARAIEDPDLSVRESAIAATSAIRSGTSDLLPLILKQLREDTPGAAAAAIGKLGSEAQAAVPDLVELLGNSHWVVRNNSAFALGRLGTAAIPAIPAIPALNALLNDPNLSVRRNAAYSLWKLDGRTNIVAILTSELEARETADSQPLRIFSTMHRTMIEQLGEIGPKAAEAIPVLSAFLQDNDERIRTAAGDALDRITDSRHKSE
ncbi:MAG: HEAT repeat domain-containing protein [Verrucomicrobia bacterium]|nr:HEAT repeat domain-containing protein [Verrucomicrobiota bacterium]